MARGQEPAFIVRVEVARQKALRVKLRLGGGISKSKYARVGGETRETTNPIVYGRKFILWELLEVHVHVLVW